MAQSNSQTYLLKVLEMPGKSVTQQYISVVKDKLDKHGLTHSINIVVDENLVRNAPQINGQSGGGDGSTFPYNIFEGALDTILRRQTEDQPQEKGWISNTYDKLKGYNQERQGIFDKLFSYTPLDDVNNVKTEEQVVKSDEVEPIESAVPIESIAPNEPSVSTVPANQPDNMIATNIDFPQNYSGVLYIQVVIYEQPNGDPDLTLGLHELNQLIMT